MVGEVTSQGLARGLALVKGAGGLTVSTKQLVYGDANTFYVNTKLASGKVLSQSIIKNNGSNDAGAAHEPWRLGPTFIVDALTDNPSTINFKNIAQSNGAKDYALKWDAGPFGGSFHGGEVNLVAPVLTLDGVAFDPSNVAGATGKKLQLQQNSRITWPAGQTADIVSSMLFEEDGVNSIAHSIATAATVNSGATAYPTLTFADPRLSEMTVNGVVTALTGNPQSYDLALDARNVKFRDTRTLDSVEADLSFSKALGRLWVLYSQGANGASYAKLYCQAPEGLFGSWDVTQKVRYGIGDGTPIPALPYTDTFDGAALSPYWRLAQTAGGPTYVVTGGEWVVTNDVNNRWTHPICNAKSPGTYHIELDYKGDTNTGTTMILYVMRHDGGSNTNPLQTFNLNSFAGTTLAFDVVVAAGQSPVLMLQTGIAGRGPTRFRELRITKTA